MCVRSQRRRHGHEKDRSRHTGFGWRGRKADEGERLLVGVGDERRWLNRFDLGNIRDVLHDVTLVLTDNLARGALHENESLWDGMWIQPMWGCIHLRQRLMKFAGVFLGMTRKLLGGCARFPLERHKMGAPWERDNSQGALAVLWAKSSR